MLVIEFAFELECEFVFRKVSILFENYQNSSPNSPLGDPNETALGRIPTGARFVVFLPLEGLHYTRISSSPTRLLHVLHELLPHTP